MLSSEVWSAVTSYGGVRSYRQVSVYISFMCTMVALVGRVVIPVVIVPATNHPSFLQASGFSFPGLGSCRVGSSPSEYDERHVLATFPSRTWS